ncbi:MAG: site-2 protease family protein [Treponema sp.]|nr:site-2 protease family protein [Treponema sp.]MCL2251213.1 site-2 protease family protein [Treponema sp.]
MFLVIIKILLGLLGLGIVVFVHELGHFLAARLVKIHVEAFSIGWGNPILKKKIGSVEYRLGMFPVGGYCKMKGETDYNKAWENMEQGIKPEEGSYLAASPLARILVAFAGPFFNLIFAMILLSFIWGFGFEINTIGNKIILASEIMPEENFPADIAGLKTGDRIVEIGNKSINYYHEIQENIALNPSKSLPVTIEREGKYHQLQVTPNLDKSSGAGKIGVMFWIDPVIESVKKGSIADHAGLFPGDRIVNVNGIPVNNTEDFRKIRAQEPENYIIKYERKGMLGETAFTADNNQEELGFAWETIRYRTPNLSIPAAVAKGFKEGIKTLKVSITSLRLLFMGIDLTKAVSGPVRITYMIGESAAQGFGQGFSSGLRSMAEFIALISVALCVMNLLPLPIIDGGMIILFFIEMIRKKPIPPKAISIFQTCGMVIIGCLFVFAVFGDIMFFIRQ